MFSQSDSNATQFNTFKDALARRIISRPGFDDESNDPGELDDFASYLASEAWPALPDTLRSATYQTRSTIPFIDELSLDNVPPPFVDSLTSCGLCDDPDGALAFLRRVLDDYVADACAPPPVWSKTRTTECEICERAVPLTYHHLIPREVHAKVLKKKWHPEEMLGSVAWLCRYVVAVLVSWRYAESLCALVGRAIRLCTVSRAMKTLQGAGTLSTRSWSEKTSSAGGRTPRSNDGALGEVSPALGCRPANLRDSYLSLLVPG